MTSAATTDERLIAYVRRGDQSSLTALYDRYSGRIYGMALQKLGDPAAAEDATHDVFVNVWQKASTFYPEKGKLSSWLLTIAHNQIVDDLRRKRRSREIQEAVTRDPTFSTTSVRDDPDDAASLSEVIVAVRQALLALSEEQREVVVSAYYLGYSQSQIAERLDIPLGTVKSRMRLAMTKLRSEFNTGGAD